MNKNAKSVIEKQLKELKGHVNASVKKAFMEKYGKWWWIFFYQIDRLVFFISLLAFLGLCIMFIVKGLGYLFEHPEEILKPLIAIIFSVVGQRLMKKRK